MGIPRLLSHLQPYAAPLTLPPTTQSTQAASTTSTSTTSTSTTTIPPQESSTASPQARKRPVIIDGPAFCYHIYHLCKCYLADGGQVYREDGSAGRSGPSGKKDRDGGGKAERDVMDVVSGYDFLAEMAVTWLNELEECGLRV